MCSVCALVASGQMHQQLQEKLKPAQTFLLCHNSQLIVACESTCRLSRDRVETFFNSVVTTSSSTFECCRTPFLEVLFAILDFGFNFFTFSSSSSRARRRFCYIRVAVVIVIFKSLSPSPSKRSFATKGASGLL